MFVALKDNLCLKGAEDKFLDKREVKSGVRLVNYMFWGCE